MSWFNNLNIQAKLLIGFGTVLVLVGVIVTANTVTSRKSASTYDFIANHLVLDRFVVGQVGAAAAAPAEVARGAALRGAVVQAFLDHQPRCACGNLFAERGRHRAILETAVRRQGMVTAGMRATMVAARLIT